MKFKRKNLCNEMTTFSFLKRESDDLEFVLNSDIDKRAFLSALPQFDNKYQIKEFNPKDKVEFAVCARVDMEHPIISSKNLFGQCEDCGCDIQYSSNMPMTQKICICCTAERTREEIFGKKSKVCLNKNL